MTVISYTGGGTGRSFKTVCHNVGEHLDLWEHESDRFDRVLVIIQNVGVKVTNKFTF